MSSVQSTFAAVIESDRIALCNLLKSLDFGDDTLYSKLKTAPIPDMPEEFTKKSKVKKEKSGKPRRVSGQVLFCKDFYAKAKEEGDVGLYKDVIQQAKDAWDEKDEETKKQWNDLSNEKFDNLVEAYKISNPDYDPDAKAVKVKISVPRSKSPYILFVSHMSKSGDFENGKTLMTEAGAKWKLMSDEEKEPFVKISLESKNIANNFQRFVKMIKKELISAGVEDTKKVIELEAVKKWNLLSDDEKIISDDEADSDEDKPKKTKNEKVNKAKAPTRTSAYNHFVSQFDGEVPEGEKLMTVAGEKWKSMSDEEKKPFVELAEKSKEIANEFKEFVKENESSIREEIKDKLEKETDEKKQKKMIKQEAAEKWAILMENNDTDEEKVDEEEKAEEENEEENVEEEEENEEENVEEEEENVDDEE